MPTASDEQMSREKRIALFHRGADAVRAAFGLVDTYLCPVCGEEYDRGAAESSVLTLEHVPPASIGGTELVLTCKTCNNGSGHEVDAHVDRRAELVRLNQLFGGRRDHQASMKLEIDDGSFSETLNAVVSREGDGPLRFDIPERQNDPHKVARVVQYAKASYEKGTGEGLEFRVHSRVGMDPHRAAISDLKSGFLAAFALLGYSYALDPELDLVRQQIRNPSDRILDRWMLKPGPNAPPGRVIFLPAAPDCLIVKLDHGCVLLPWPGAPGQYVRAQRHFATGSSETLNGKVWRFPTRMKLLVDFSLAQDR